MRTFIPLLASLSLALSSASIGSAASIGSFASMASAASMAPQVADKKPDDNASRVVEELAACRTIVEPMARLACFDRTATALVTARDNKSIVVVDRAEVRKVNRSLFGFALPNLNLFGKDDPADEPPIPEINGKIVKSTLIGRDLFALTLEDGTVWRMNESLGRYPPNDGDKIRIVRGALGSFRATIAGGRYIQVNRVR